MSDGETPTQTEPGRIFNAVTDLGMDKTGGKPIDTRLSKALQPDTQIRFPAGTYKVTAYHNLPDRVGIIGIADDRSKVRFVPPKGESLQPFTFNNAAGLRFANFTMDRRKDWQSSLGMGGAVKRDFRLENVEYDGWTHNHEQMLTIKVTDPNGTAVVDGLYRTGPTKFETFPDGVLDIWSGQGHRGHLTLRDIEIHNGSESGIYTGKSEGTYLIEDCFMKNVVHTAIRCAGKDSVVRNCKVVMDTDDWHPGNVNNTAEPPALVRGFWAQSSDKRLTAPRIENCEFVIKNTQYPGAAGIMIARDTGGAVIRDTTITCHSEVITPIFAKNPTEEAGKPVRMDLKNVQVRGRAWDRGAITVLGRPWSVITNCSVSSRNGNDGIVMERCGGSTVKNTTIDVSGTALDLSDGPVMVIKNGP